MSTLPFRMASSIAFVSRSISEFRASSFRGVPDARTLNPMGASSRTETTSPFGAMANRPSQASNDVAAPLRSTPAGRPMNRKGVSQVTHLTRTSSVYLLIGPPSVDESRLTSHWHMNSVCLQRASRLRGFIVGLSKRGLGLRPFIVCNSCQQFSIVLVADESDFDASLFDDFALAVWERVVNLESITNAVHSQVEAFASHGFECQSCCGSVVHDSSSVLSGG